MLPSLLSPPLDTVGELNMDGASLTVFPTSHVLYASLPYVAVGRDRRGGEGGRIEKWQNLSFPRRRGGRFVHEMRDREREGETVFSGFGCSERG